MDLRPNETEANDRDLGFGSEVAARSQRRFINPDGSFNVERHGLGWRANLSLYHQLISMSWLRFVGLVVALYLLINAVFALAYVACGAQALAGAISGPLAARLLQAFFFSVQTFSTVGYGGVEPASLAANIVMTVESVTGLLSVALVTGLVFARFSHPVADIVFSRHGIVAPYRGITAFEFRIANSRRNQIVDLQARVILATLDPERPGKRIFRQLHLERDKVSFFPLSWTVVHPIDDDSPLAGLAPTDLERMEAEFLILLSGFDETFSQIVHTRSSYKAHEMRWNVKFSSMFESTPEDRSVAMDISRIHELEEVETPAASAS
ncbi:MAG: ion channel [Acidobacteria bacterium]|nr:ion channel [Acidobacteriota bacterium]